MIRRLDKLWLVVLGRAHRWILCQVAAHCRRERVPRAEAQCHIESMVRLERTLASQKAHLN